MNAKPFRELAAEIVARHSDTSLTARWEDAESIDPDLQPEHFWIRDTEDLINIVWLAKSALIDLTWFPKRQMSTLTTLHTSAIIGLEIRDAAGAADELDLVASGNLVVTIHAIDQQAGVTWVAAPGQEDNAQMLRNLTVAVLKATHR